MAQCSDLELVIYLVTKLFNIWQLYTIVAPLAYLQKTLAHLIPCSDPAILAIQVTTVTQRARTS